MIKTSDFDLVVYGATGFTGRLVAEHLLANYGAGPGARLNWAIAGRSLGRLAELRDAMGAGDALPIIAADAVDPQAIGKLVSRTRAVLTTAGPFQLYGSELVAACADQGVDYLDLAGEPAWIAQMIATHSVRARKSGARILHSCGFDSIPFELGVSGVQALAQALWGRPASHVKGRVLRLRGALSGGSVASGHATLAALQSNPALAETLSDPFAFTPGFRGPPQPSRQAPYFDEDVGTDVGPFIMATVNVKTVHRANFLMGHPYGRDFTYDEMEVIQAETAFPLSAFGPGGPKPGEGPSEYQRMAGFFDLLFVGHDPDGARLKVTVHGDLDPGYGSTAKMISETAICLLTECSDVPGGSWTPGAAMGKRLLDRLQARAGLRFAPL